jgi:tRNA(Arg) A34 adenosine deaminase TadA
MTDIHADFIRETILLALAAREKGNGPFGSLLVKDGVVLLRAENTVNTDHDVTCHAETNLVRLAGQRYDRAFLSSCTLYTSTEPCAMCAGAIFWSGIGRIVFGCSEAKLSEFNGGALNIPCRAVLANTSSFIEIVGPVIEDEATAPHIGFWDSHRGEAL